MATTPASPLPAIDPRWVWSTRIGAVGAMVLVGAGMFRALFPQLWDPCARWIWVNLLYFPAVLFPYGRVLWDMRGRGQRRGLVTAVAWGVLGLAAIALVFGLLASEGKVRVAVWASLAALVHAGLVGAAFGGLRAAGPERGRWRELLKAVLGWGIYLVAAMIFLGTVAASTMEMGAGGESAVAGRLRTLNTALVAYTSNHPEQGFPPDLARLGPQGENLVEGAMAQNRFSMRGYDFVYEPGPADAEGRIVTYILSARPVRLGWRTCRSFLTDQSGVIHSTAEHRPATAADPPL